MAGVHAMMDASSAGIALFDPSGGWRMERAVRREMRAWRRIAAAEALRWTS